MTDATRNTLHKVISILSVSASPVWAFTGSTGMYMQGMALTVHDIDIQATAESTYEIERRLLTAGEPQIKVYYRESERMRSHYGKLLIAGVEVELMGAIQHRNSGGEWEPTIDLSSIRVFAMWEGRKVPVISLQHEMRAYALMGRLDKMRAIQAYLSEHNRNG